MTPQDPQLTFEHFWNVVHPSRLVPKGDPTPAAPSPDQERQRLAADAFAHLQGLTSDPAPASPEWREWLEHRAVLCLYVARRLLGEDSSEIEPQAFDLRWLPTEELIRTYRRVYPNDS